MDPAIKYKEVMAQWELEKSRKRIVVECDDKEQEESKRLRLEREQEIEDINQALIKDIDLATKLHYLVRRSCIQKRLDDEKHYEALGELKDQARELISKAKKKKTIAIHMYTQKMSDAYKPTLVSWLKDKLVYAKDVTKSNHIIHMDEYEHEGVHLVVTPPSDMREHLPTNDMLITCADDAVDDINKEFPSNDYRYTFTRFQEAVLDIDQFYPEVLIFSIEKITK
jgi:hypothetical protein